MFLGLGDPGSWIEWLIHGTVYSTKVGFQIIYLPYCYLTFQSFLSTRKGHMGVQERYFKFNSGVNSLAFLLAGNRSRPVIMNEHLIVSDKRNWTLTAYETQKTWTSSVSLSLLHLFSHLYVPVSHEAWLLARAWCSPSPCRTRVKWKWQISKWRELIVTQLLKQPVVYDVFFKELNRLFLYWNT